MSLTQEQKQLQRLRKEIREALADYMQSEGCGCCEDTVPHEAAKDKLGKLLKVRKYKGSGGYDFTSHQSKNK